MQMPLLDLQDILRLDQPAHFTCRAVWQAHGSQAFYEVSVDHQRQTWQVQDLTDGIESKYADGLLHIGTEITPSYSYRARVSISALQLIFPERLHVWGRPFHRNIRTWAVCRARSGDSPVTIVKLPVIVAPYPSLVRI